MIKGILAYDIEDGVSESDYNDWLVDVHIPDLLANPYIDRIIFNTFLRAVDMESVGMAPIHNSFNPYRVAEILYEDEDAYEKSLDWFRANPVAEDRGPAGRTKFHFYMITTVLDVDRTNMGFLNRADARASLRGV